MPSSVPSLFPVREAARRLAVTPRTLKYYEELGLVTPDRSEGRYRLYSEDDLDKFARILRLRSLGFSLQAIAEMLKRPLESESDGSKRYSMASLQQVAVALAEQIAQLDVRIAGVKRELKEAVALRGELGDDLTYLQQRLAGVPAEALAGERLAARKRRATARKRADAGP